MIRLRHEFRELIAAAWGARPSRFCFLGFCLIGIALAAVAYHFDRPIAKLAPVEGGPFSEVAGEFSYWGDFVPGTLPLSLALILFGSTRKKIAWRRAGLAVLLAATLAGTLVSSFRLTLGRPRPYATQTEMLHDLGHPVTPWLSFGGEPLANQLHDGFYGPQPSPMFEGFPSGHAATSIASATALAAVLPPVGAVTVVGAAGVCWSRSYLRRHYASDLFVGGWVGLGMGLWIGGVGRRLNQTKFQEVAAVSRSA